jgi:hypothetical protein
MAGILVQFRNTRRLFERREGWLYPVLKKRLWCVLWVCANSEIALPYALENAGTYILRMRWMADQLTATPTDRSMVASNGMKSANPTAVKDQINKAQVRVLRRSA